MSGTLLYMSMTAQRECCLEISDKELHVMIAAGVDIEDEDAIMAFYRSNLGKTIDGVTFADAYELFDDWYGQSLPEIEQMWIEA